MEEPSEIVKDILKKTSRGLRQKWRYTIAAVVLLLIISSLVYIWLTQEKLKPDPASEKIIRESAASILNKDPNELTDEDFAKLTEFYLFAFELSDIKLLEKFTNLKSLDFLCLRFPQKDIPKWMKLISKLGIFDLNDRFYINLSPLKNLTKLQRLKLCDTNVVTTTRGIPRPGIVLYLPEGTPIKNIEPLSDLVNLKELYLCSTRVRDLKPLKGLKELQVLALDETQVSSLKTMKGLKNLEYLSIRNCKYITNEEVEDLQKALPNLKIER